MKRQIAIFGLLAIAGATAGCGGSGSGSGSGSGGAGPPPPTAMDTYFTAVKSVISTSDDAALPLGVEATVATSPEDSLPEAIY